MKPQQGGHNHEAAGQKGFLLVAAVILIVVIAMLMTTVAHIMTIQGSNVSDRINATQAFYIANSGLSLGRHALRTGTACAAINGRRGLTRVKFSQGQVTLTARHYHPTSLATLSKTINHRATVIPLSSILGYAGQGRVMIGDEWIAYRGTSTRMAICGKAPCLIKAERGMGGTHPAAHNYGSVVEQQQCHLIAVAGVPGLVHPRARRRISENVYTHHD